MDIVSALSSEWWSWVFHASWQSAAVGLLLVGLVLLFRRLPAPVRYGLLVVALVKFAVPPVIGVRVETPAAPAVSRAETRQAAEASAEVLPATVLPAEPCVSVGSTAVAKPAETASPEPAGRHGLPELPWQARLLLAHVLGAVLVLAALLYSYSRLCGVAQCCSVEQGRLRARFDELREQLGVRGRVDLLVARGDVSPMALGLFRRRVVVPEHLLDELSPAQIDAILAHELAHHARRDTWCIMLENLLLVFWWFHPVFWLVLRVLRSVREDCCDDRLLEAGITDDDAYCESLLRAAATVQQPRLARAALGFADTFHPLGRRLRRIMDVSIRRHKGLSAGAVAGLLALMLIVAPGIRVVAADPAEVGAPDESTQQISGEVVFEGSYQHDGRGQDHQAVRLRQDGSLLAVAEMPFMEQKTTAEGNIEEGLTYYAIDGDNYKIAMEFEPGKVFVTRNGIRENWERKQFDVPEEAVFVPNTRPDPYCMQQVALRLMPDLPEGETREFNAYDWDNTGDGFAFYKTSLTNAGMDTVDVPAGKFRARHFVERQLTSADTWFKKRAGHITDFWLLDDGTIIRILRHREPYELQLASVTTPEEIPQRLGPPSPVPTEEPQAAEPAGPTPEITKQILAEPAPELLEQASGTITLNALYRHKSRGHVIDVPEHRWVKTGPDGSITTVCNLPFMQSTYLAAGGPQGFQLYEIHRDRPAEDPDYHLVMDFEPGQAIVSRTGIREDWDKKVFEVPPGAVFDPNTRPDPYCALQVFERAFTVAGGQSIEVDAYDWDNTGDGLAFYKLEVKNVGYEEVTAPCGRFEATHVVIQQLTSADTWFKKRAGHVTDVWLLADGTIVRVLRHREPYEIELLAFSAPETLPGLLERAEP